MSLTTRYLLHVTTWWPAYLLGDDPALPVQTDVERGRTIAFLNGAIARYNQYEEMGVIIGG